MSNEGDKLRERFREEGVSQADVAILSGETQVQIGRMLAGTAQLTAKVKLAAKQAVLRKRYETARAGFEAWGQDLKDRGISLPS